MTEKKKTTRIAEPAADIAAPQPETARTEAVKAFIEALGWEPSSVVGLDVRKGVVRARFADNSARGVKIGDYRADSA